MECEGTATVKEVPLAAIAIVFRQPFFYLFSLPLSFILALATANVPARISLQGGWVGRFLILALLLHLLCLPATDAMMMMMTTGLRALILMIRVFHFFRVLGSGR